MKDAEQKHHHYPAGDYWQREQENAHTCGRLARDEPEDYDVL